MQKIGLDMVSSMSFWHSLPVSKSQEAQVRLRDWQQCCLCYSLYWFKRRKSRGHWPFWKSPRLTLPGWGSFFHGTVCLAACSGHWWQRSSTLGAMGKTMSELLGRLAHQLFTMGGCGSTQTAYWVLVHCPHSVTPLDGMPPVSLLCTNQNAPPF